MTEWTSITGGPRRSLASLLVVGLSIGAVACGDDSGGDPAATSLSDDAVIEYQFQDASVEPESHRSYTLTIQRDEVHAVVDSYGDVIGETSEPLPEEVWDGLVDGYGDVASISSVDSDCDGGTGRSITVTEADEVLVHASLSPCDDPEGEEMVEQLDAYVDPVIAAIPDWDSLFEQ